jgi:hypothetical protein
MQYHNKYYIFGGGQINYSATFKNKIILFREVN